MYCSIKRLQTSHKSLDVGFYFHCTCFEFLSLHEHLLLNDNVLLIPFPKCAIYLLLLRQFFLCSLLVLSELHLLEIFQLFDAVNVDCYFFLLQQATQLVSQSNPDTPNIDKVAILVGGGEVTVD